jgi:hypothetical protein
VYTCRLDALSSSWSKVTLITRTLKSTSFARLAGSVFATGLSTPHGLAVDSGGNLYVANYGNDTTTPGTMSVIETTCNTVVTATVPVEHNPVAFGLFIDGSAGAPPPVEPPPTNLHVTGMEVTQAIQDLANSVPLVSGRRTFVRVYVQSDGPAVPGVTATLSGAGTILAPGAPGGAVTVPLGSLVPVNPYGPRITVRPLPKRSILRSRSFMTFADKPVDARSNALGRLHPSARSRRSPTDHLHPTMLSTIEATGMALASCVTGVA